ncbi:hypothetical protein [Bacteroides sp.]|uniref:hypothetical protein n=1 Tax=Bacteroides sp. TaxID=29523 RepID=UPI003AB47070
MFRLLETYSHKGSFYFASDDNLRVKCKDADVPDNCCGVYIVSGYFGDKEIILYIGSSGHIEDGKPKPRNGGLRRRIYGKQKDSGKLVQRSLLWSDLMDRQHINKLKISWYNTELDNPLVVEYCLILEYVVRHKRLPAWNNELKLDGRLKEELEGFIIRNDIEILKV